MKNIEKQLQQVWDFQETFCHSQTTELFTGTAEKREFRLSLFVEELEELKEAIDQDNNVEKLDATIDMIYILLGSVQYHGLGSTFNAFLLGETEYTNTTIRNYEKLLKDVLNTGFTEKYLSSRTKITYSEIINFYLELVVLCLSLYNKLESEGIVKENYFYDAFLEVHSSNMSKLDKHGNPIFRGDGKIMKGEFYYKPELEQFLTSNK
jgi:predicted HAD superfamily Cof-like phosphohydrolase